MKLTITRGEKCSRGRKKELRVLRETKKGIVDSVPCRGRGALTIFGRGETEGKESLGPVCAGGGEEE